MAGVERVTRPALLVVYVHGFRSSPLSAKSRLISNALEPYFSKQQPMSGPLEPYSSSSGVKQPKSGVNHATSSGRPDSAFQVDFVSPQLPPSPKQSMALLEDLAVKNRDKDVCFVGSSLGGFYSTLLVERDIGDESRRWALLLNPAIHPAKDLAAYVGEQTMWHKPEETYDFKREYIVELEEMEQELLGGLRHADRFSGLFCTGDEVIPWTDMVGRFGRGGNIRIVEGSDHGISDFDQHLPFVMDAILRRNQRG